MHVAAYMLIATRLSHEHCQVMQHQKSRCDMRIIGTRLLQHRCATNTDRLLHERNICCLALQLSTPCYNVTLTVTWSKLELGATCCNAHMKFATVGLFVAIVTPSQIVVAAAAAVAHTAPLKSHHARVPPAIGTPLLCGTRVLYGSHSGAYSKKVLRGPTWRARFNTL
jgi:hypothetical protein